MTVVPFNKHQYCSSIISPKLALKIQQQSTPLQEVHKAAEIIVTNEPEARRQSLKQ